MDDFLTKMYEEEQEKVASADLQGLFDQFSVDQLAVFLGMDKEALAFTRAGHQMDASIAGAKKKALLAESAARDKYRAENPGKAYLTDAGIGGLVTKLQARHQSYKEKKHKGRRNAWNPFGGMATVMPEERSKKAGIPGPDEAPMPAGVKGTKVIDKAELRKQRGEEVQKQVEADTDQKEKESGCGVKHASARWADQMGRFLAQDLVKEAGFASMMAKGIGSKALKPTAMKGVAAAAKGMARPSAVKAVAGKGLAQRAAQSAMKRSPFQSAASRLSSKARSLARPVAQRTSNLLRRI